MNTLPESSKVKKSAKPVSATKRAGSWGSVCFVCTAAVLLLALSLGAYWWHYEQLADIATEQLRLVVTGPPSLQSGLPARYTVSTTAVTGKAMPSQVELSVFSPEGKQLLQQKDKTDEEGNLTIVIPSDLKIPSGSRLEVLAVSNNKFERMDTKVAVESPESHLAARKFPIRRTQPPKNEKEPAKTVQDGGAQETADKTIPGKPDKVAVEFFPEGGGLTAGLENRVYFTARNSAGKPIELKGNLLDSRGDVVARVETGHAGMGVFSLYPQPGEAYRLEILSPQTSNSSKPQLPPAISDSNVVLTTGSGVFNCGEPLKFNVRAGKAGLPLVASARCRGVPLSQTAFVTRMGPNSVTLPLPDEAAGVIRLTVYDYGANSSLSGPPLPLAERLVYRRRGKRLNIEVTGKKPFYQPGETVELKLAAAELEKPADIENADFYLSDSPQAAAALDLLLGTQDRRDDESAKAAGPPMVFDNMSEIGSRYKASLADYRSGRTKYLNAITTVAAFAAASLLLLVAMLNLLGVVGGLKVWLPSLAAASACAVVGATLLNPNRPGTMPDDVPAFRPFSAESSGPAPKKDNGNEAASAHKSAAEIDEKPSGSGPPNDVAKP